MTLQKKYPNLNLFWCPVYKALITKQACEKRCKIMRKEADLTNHEYKVESCFLDDECLYCERNPNKLERKKRMEVNRNGAIVFYLNKKDKTKDYIICESTQYRYLLEGRLKALQETGDVHMRQCMICKRWEIPWGEKGGTNPDFQLFRNPHRPKGWGYTLHISCRRQRCNEYNKKRKERGDAERAKL